MGNGRQMPSLVGLLYFDRCVRKSSASQRIEPSEEDKARATERVVMARWAHVLALNLCFSASALLSLTLILCSCMPHEPLLPKTGNRRR